MTWAFFDDSCKELLNESRLILLLDLKGAGGGMLRTFGVTLYFS